MQTEKTMQSTKEIEELSLTEEIVNLADDTFEIIEALEDEKFKIFKCFKPENKPLHKKDMIKYAAILMRMYETIKGDIDDEAWDVE
jgi:predicted RNA-binding protein with EMAP domain